MSLSATITSIPKLVFCCRADYLSLLSLSIEGIATLSVTLSRCVCVRRIVSAAKVMRYIQCSLVTTCSKLQPLTVE